jgi:hypothetical protein|nr:MAG TPA: hypothetical protein [Caudoviricetes sp.]
MISLEAIPEELYKHVDKLRGQGIHITDEEVKEVYMYCLRKMEVAKVENPEQYIELLYPDELRHYIIRHGVNASTILRKIEGTICV